MSLPHWKKFKFCEFSFTEEDLNAVEVKFAEQDKLFFSKDAEALQIR